MKIRTVCIAALLVLLMALPLAAKEKRADGLRIGAYLAGIDYVSRTDEYEGGDHNYTSPGIGIGLLSNEAHGGLVAGYFITKNHEVGGMATLYARSWTTSNGDDVKGSNNGIRIGPYYDYNFQLNEVMNPFIGGHLGLFRISSKTEDEQDVTSGWFLGPQGGLKVNIYKHVSLDLTGYMDIGRGSGEHSNEHDYDWDISFWNLGVYGGISVYVF
ncbi:MAG: outer membrane beta-barrel protein [Candidatus Alcyoniella australis]|nr:outer membrane beta-barrel protein [Candidatus Alcyoniella australis]